MEKMLEIILKNVPAAVIPGIVAAVALYFGVYFYRAHRNYSDTLHDRVFLSGLVIVGGLFVLFHIHRDRTPAPVSDADTPVVIVPEFNDDERGQYRTLFVQHLQTALSSVDKGDRAVLTLDSYVTNHEGAQLTGKKYGARAVVYHPRVVRTGSKTMVCFSVYVMEGGYSKPYPPIVIDIDKAPLDDLAQMLVFSQRAGAGSPKANPLVARLDSLEKQVDDLRLALSKKQETRPAAAVIASGVVPAVAPAPTTYKAKKAILIGVDKFRNSKFPPLRFAVSDARRTASALQARGFETTVLENATKEELESRIQNLVAKSDPDDLIVVYLSGMTVKSTDLGFQGKPVLILPASDVSTDDMSANVTLPALAALLDKAKARHKLVVIDGCHGTVGLESDARSAATTAGSRESFLVLAGSQDDQYSYETPETGGGVLTTAFVEAISKKGLGELTMRKAFEELSVTVDAMTRKLGSRQTPKLLNLRGSGTIVL